jgi:integrase
MRGHLRRRGKNSFELKWDAPREGGGRKTHYKSFKGSRREAMAELNKILAQVADGIAVEPSKVTVGQYVAQRIEQWAATGTISPKTAERYRSLLAQQIAPHLGTRPLQKLTPADIERWHTALQNTPRQDGKGWLSARTIGHAHRVLSKTARDATRLELLPRNVVAVQPPPKVVAEEIRILSPEQVAALPALLDGHPLAAPTIIALFTGMRRGEILGLHWGAIDFDGKLIKVRRSLEETATGLRFKPPKSKAGIRDITLPDVVVDALRQQRKQLLERRLVLGLGRLGDEDLCFPQWDTRSPQMPDTFSSTWKKMAKSHGLNISFHALRHTHASQLIAAGMDIATICQRLGHASPHITLRTYAHMFSSDDSKAAEAINMALRV